MDQHSGELSAWHWVNRESFARLKECIATLGEEPQAGRIARVIVEARQKAPIDSTAELAALVEKAYPPAWRAKARRHPATRTFQALRMAVNDELGELRRFLDQILAWLPVGGRLAVITFHSLEDRMVKQAMRHWAEGCRCPRHVPVCVCRHQPEVRILHKKPLQAGPEELAVNPRAGSAKLRAVEKNRRGGSLMLKKTPPQSATGRPGAGCWLWPWACWPAWSWALCWSGAISNAWTPRISSISRRTSCVNAVPCAPSWSGTRTPAFPL